MTCATSDKLHGTSLLEPGYLPFASARMGAAARVSTVQLRNALAKCGWSPGAIEPDAQGWPAFAVIGAMGEPLLVSVQVAMPALQTQMGNAS